MNTIREFTIILVDDEAPSMDAQIADIKQYLVDEKNIETINFHSVNVKDKTFLEEIYTLLEKQVNLILTDNSMIDPDDGIKLAKDIRNNFKLIDILVYSAKEITIDDYRDLSHYTQIQAHDDRKIVEVTKDLIDRNLAKWDDIFFLRGIVISESIEVELKINELLIKFFEIPEEKKTSFENLILSDFSVSMGAKRTMLHEVLIEAKLENLWTDISTKIENLQRDRNKLAHGRVDPENVNRFIVGNSGKTFGKEKIISIFSNIKVIDAKLLEIDQALENKMTSSTESKEQSETEPTQ